MTSVKTQLKRTIAAIALGLSLATVGVATASAAPAVSTAAMLPSIHMPDPFSCLTDYYTGNQGYTIFENRDPSTASVAPMCFANSGAMDFTMSWIWNFRAGNNSGYFTYIEYNGGGAYLNRNFSKGLYLNYLDAIKLTSINIL